MMIVEAKKQFIKTGRLNRKIIRDEIALSWYRCRLNNVDHNKNWFDKSFADNVQSKIDVDSFKNLLVRWNREIWNTFIINLNGEAILRITYDAIFEPIHNLSEQNLGTNAGAIGIKTLKEEVVHHDEHYLSLFNAYDSYAFPIKQEDEVVAFLVIFTKSPMNSYDIKDFKSHLASASQNAKSQIPHSEAEIMEMGHFIMLPKQQEDALELQIDKMVRIGLPIYIHGPKGSGKSNLAWYIATTRYKDMIFLDIDKIPSVMRKKMIQNALCQNETLVIDNIHSLEAELIMLLTVYTEEKIIQKNEEKYSNCKCYNIILTSVYKPREMRENRMLNERFSTRMCHQVITTSDFKEHRLEKKELERLLQRYRFEFSEGFKSMMLKLSNGKEIDEIVTIIENTTIASAKGKIITAEDIVIGTNDSYKTLSEMERQYIIDVYEKMEHNMTLTSEILGIGRSTLYRKLKLYHIETKS
jgi:transcriptional regulator of acetoin/glycerol metabolism